MRIFIFIILTILLIYATEEDNKCIIQNVNFKSSVVINSTAPCEAKYVKFNVKEI